jgi:hypothetical protein
MTKTKNPIPYGPIAETRVIRLSLEAQCAFANAVLNPPPTTAMKNAFALHRKLIREVR